MESGASRDETPGGSLGGTVVAWSDDAAFAPVAELDRAARHTKIDTEEGFAVWRQWGSGPTLVLLHGGSGSWAHFYRQIEFFSANYRVLVPDMPGFGDSKAGNPGPDPEAMARILAAGIERLSGEQRVYLGGFSYGGIIGGFLARLIRSRISGFVIIGGVGFDAKRQTVSLSSWRHLPDVAARRAMHRNNLAAIMIADPARIDPTAILIQEYNAERARHDTRPIARSKPLTDVLDASGVPLAAIWGELDHLATPYFDERRAWLAERDPQARFELIAGAGHWVQYEAADAFNTTLAACLRSFADRDRAPTSFQGGQHDR